MSTIAPARGICLLVVATSVTRPAVGMEETSVVAAPVAGTAVTVVPVVVTAVLVLVQTECMINA